VRSVLAAARRDPLAERPNARPFFWRVDGAVPVGTLHLPDERVTAATR
jgi:hypothetical protein